MPDCKKIIALTAAVLVLAVAGGCTSPASTSTDGATYIAEGTAGNDVSKSEFTITRHTDSLLFEMNPDTTAFRVTQTESGRMWNSGSSQSEKTFPLLELTYRDRNGVVHYVNSYTDSVQRGQYSIEQSTDIRVNYSFGNIEGRQYCPHLLSEQRFKSYSEKVSDSDRKFLDQLYTRLDVSELEASAREEKIKQYPPAADGVVYVLRSSTLSKTIKNRLHTLLQSVGYTDADRDADAVYDAEDAATPRFNVSVVYRLEGSTLSVSIPSDSIAFSADTPLEEIRLLPNFASEGLEKGGYWLLPDGSGSVMEFYNGKAGLQAYSVPIYGRDKAVAANESTFVEQQAILPIFGCSAAENGFLAVIDDGDALATVSATPGSDTEYPTACASFTVVQNSKINTVTAGGESQNSFYITHQSNIYDGAYSVSYHFLSGSEATLNGMARLYRKLLFGDRERTAPDGLPIYIEFIGEVNIEKSVAGITFKHQLVLSSFNDVRASLDSLASLGVETPHVILSGFLNGGYHQGYLNKFRISSGVGGKEGLTSLLSYMDDADIPYFLEAETQYAYDKGFFDGFSVRSQSTHMLNRKKGECYPISTAYFNADTTRTPYYMLSPSAISASFGTVSAGVNEFGISGVLLRSIGRDVNGDYNENNMTERQHALLELVKQTDTLKKQLDRLMITVGDAPFLDDADTVRFLPLSSCGYDITDYSVPFTAMVLSGVAEYTSEIVNLEYYDPSDYLILLETGAVPYYQVAVNNGDQLRGTQFSELFAVRFSDQVSRIAEDSAVSYTHLTLPTIRLV